MLTQVTATQRFQDVAAEKFATVKLYGKGAVPRVINEGKTPAPFVGTRLAAGNVVYSRIDARHGAFAIVDECLHGAVVSKDFPQFAIRSENVDRQYLKWILTSPDFYGRIQAMSFGATNRQRMSEAAFLTMSIPLPGVEGQRRIAAILDQADELRAKRRRTLALLDEMQKSLFGDVDVANSPRRPLAEVATTTSGGTPSRKHASFFQGSIPWVKSGEVVGTVVRTEECLTSEGLSSSSARVVPAGTILLAMYGATAGQSAVLGIDAATNQAVCCITPGPHLRHLYLLGWLQSNKSIMKSAAVGGAQPNLSQSYVRGLQIPIPTITEQDRFLGKMAEVDSMRNATEAHLAHLDELFASLQHRAFTGQL